MDDLDREIEEAARAARKKQRQNRLATLASTATFLVVLFGGLAAVFTLFPEPDTHELDERRALRKAAGEEASAASIAEDYGAYRRDQSHVRIKVIPIAFAAMASAIFVSKRLKPKD